MSEIIVHLDQQDHKDINLGQEDAQELNLNNAHAVYGGLDFETKETESGIVKYNSETKKYSTLTPDSKVSEGSNNIVTSDAVKKYVDEFGGAIDTVSINGVIQPIDENKNVNIEIPTKISNFENDGDGTSPFATEDFVKNNVPDVDFSEIEEQINDVRAVAEGKTDSYTVETMQELSVLLGIDTSVVSDEYAITSTTIIYKGKQEELKQGDIIWVVDTDVPDYWVSVDNMKIYKMESTKINTQGLATESYVKTYVDTAINTSIISVLNTEV